MTEQKTFRNFRRFHLVRSVDASGVSGTGVVAEGVRFSNGKVSVVWTSRGITSVSVFDSVADLIAIHGHDGDTVVDYIDS